MAPLAMIGSSLLVDFWNNVLGPLDCINLRNWSRFPFKPRSPAIRVSSGRRS
jgi:hypothetical protein